MSRKMNIYYNILAGGMAGLVAWFLLSILVELGLEQANIWLRLVVMGAVVGILIGGAIGAIEGLLDRSNRKAAIGSGIGIGFGAIGGAIGLYFGEGLLHLLGGGIAGRSVGWAAFGLLVGLSQGLVMRSPRKTSYGAGGGLIGGFIGGIVLELMRGRGDDVDAWTVGVGLVLLGALIGALISSVEELLTDARIRVLAGILEGREFNLSKADTSLGCDDRCDISLPGDSAIPSWAAQLRRGSNGYDLVPLADGVTVNRATVSTTHPLRDQDRLQIGSTVLIFSERRENPLRRFDFPFKLKGLGSIFAVVLLAAAISISATGQAEAQGSIDVNVSHVDGNADFPEIKIFVSVIDSTGKPIQGLGESNFQVWEDGRRASIEVSPVSEEDVPITTVLVVDKSGSMLEPPDKLTGAKAAAETFISLMRDDDKAGIVAFYHEVEQVSGITQDKSLLRAGVSRIQANGKTAMFAAAVRAIEMLENEAGRKAIILLTDGIDTEGLAGFSTPLQALQEVTKLAVAEQLPMYTIGLGSRSGVEVNLLQALSSDTNGRNFLAPSASELGNIYSLISEQIANEYLISFDSPRPVQDGTSRNVRLQVDVGGTPVETDTKYLPCCVVVVAPIGTWDSLTWIIFSVMLAALALLLVPQGVPALVNRLETQSFRRVQTAPSPPDPTPPASPIPPQAMQAAAQSSLEWTVSVDKLPFTLGSGSNADLELNNPSISTLHAQITHEHGRYVITDLSSEGSTFVRYSGPAGRETQVNSQNAIKEGSVIRISNFDSLVFHEHPSPSMSISMPVTQRPLTIGSDSGNDIVLKGGGIQGSHARIEVQSGRYVVQPLGGGETYLSFSGDPLRESLLRDVNAIKDGSSIRIGKHSITFHQTGG